MNIPIQTGSFTKVGTVATKVVQYKVDEISGLSSKQGFGTPKWNVK